MLYLLISAEGPRMAGDLLAVDHDFHMAGIGKNGCRHTCVIRGNGITVRVELDEGGLPYESRDHPVWSVWDSRERKERFLYNGRCRRLVSAPVDALVSLLPP